ncbi:DNA cytosine methyltransferase [Enterovibrio paralichthyis]|uniref:DNA cytosine methyltransferase n=1 Tax=Enterovibrio paralichthyis TaxID=2853805 RepID=UPI001C4522A8|nr:DNA cytosine methyltransferase [Enterovibrio paralichthyis]MBV7300227.1 DNA cytosine methyltransferase [Enterovibrio paralichthyis]
MIPTVGSYFCGAGLMDTGLLEAGLNITKAFELDADAVATYRHNIGSHIKHCDISKELVLEQDSVDWMVFTYPCTKYSTAADIRQTRTGDELFLHALRHIAIASPEGYLIENVPGMRVFKVVMEAMTRLPGYYVNVFCPVHTHHWLPQRRDRLMIFGTKRPFSIRPPAYVKPISLSEIVESDPCVTRPAAIEKRMRGHYRDLPIISDPQKGDLAPTAVAHYARDKSTRLLADKRYPLGVRPYSVREYARLQGLDDSFVFPVSDTAAYRQIGNGVPRHMARWAGSEIMRYHRSYSHKI